MSEITINKDIRTVHEKLKVQLVKSGCRLVAGEAPKTVSAIQGSLWGTSPKTAQKKITFNIYQLESGNEATITTSSVLTSSYVTLTAIGVVFSIALVFLCTWIALDLQSYVSTGIAGFWGWLAQSNGYLNADRAAFFTRLSWILLTFLVGTLVAEAVIVVNVKAKIDVFAQETVRALRE